MQLLPEEEEEGKWLFSKREKNKRQTQKEKVTC